MDTHSCFCTRINTFRCRLNHMLLQGSGNHHGHFSRSSLIHFSQEPSRAGACLKSLSCVRLFCDPIDCSPPGFSVHGILQARIISFSRGSTRPRNPTWVSCLAGRFFTINLIYQGSPKLGDLKDKVTLSYLRGDNCKKQLEPLSLGVSPPDQKKLGLLEPRRLDVGTCNARSPTSEQRVLAH